MNTSKLHVIAKSLREELKRSGTVKTLQQAVKALEQLTAQPQQANNQQQLTNSLNQLYQKLEESPVDNYSPAWRDAMEEMGISREFGKTLMDDIKGIFERNQITYQVALQELKELHQKIQQTENHLNGLVQSLEYFGVGEDELEKDECEIGVIIPRNYVENNLKNFGEELVDLEKTLIVFSELATGSRVPLQVRTISSSELSVFLEYIPQIGACIAVAVERIVALYKKILEIKKLKADLVKNEVPDEKLQGIDEYAESIFDPQLKEIADELIENYAKRIEKKRKNELKIELRHALGKLANRIDRGFNIELRVARDAEEPDEEENENEHDIAINQIIESGKKIQFTRLSGEPVLFFPENESEKKE